MQQRKRYSQILQQTSYPGSPEKINQSNVITLKSELKPVDSNQDANFEYNKMEPSDLKPEANTSSMSKGILFGSKRRDY